MTVSSKIVALCLLMCITTNKIYAQHPDLGVAESFVMYTGVGAFTNLGPSVFNGDIGTNAGALNGFPPGILTGSIEVANATTLQAVSDVTAAYTNLQNRTSTGNLAPVLGNGMTVLPGVHTIGEAASINGILNLSAGGDPTAIFVFQIDGALTTSTDISVVLSNGARASHVYWQVNGLFTLESNGSFQGTLINTGAINMHIGSSLEGRALTSAGAISTESSSSILPLLGPLAIDFHNFTAICAKEAVNVNWSTLSETNNTFFEIERSSDLKSWETIGSIASAGFSSDQLDYEFLDQKPLANNSFYRVKFEDDRNEKFSKIIAINNCAKAASAMRISPNPSNGNFNLNFEGLSNEFIGMTIFNSQGKNIYSNSNQQPQFDISNQPAGVYYLVVQTKSTIYRDKIILNQ